MSNKKPKKTQHAVYDTHIHLVFVTKYRAKVFTNEMLDYARSIFEKVCEDFDGELEEFNGEADHVHLLVSHPPQVATSKLVNSLKGVSSRRLRQNYNEHISSYLWDGGLWSRSYYCGTSDGTPLSTLVSYIQNQDKPK